MVAHGEGAEAADVEVRIERKSCLYGSPRLVQHAETRQSSRKTEMHDGVVPVCVEAPAQPDDSFGIKVELHLGEADPRHPSGGQGIARRKAECLLNVYFGFLATADKDLRGADHAMGVSQVSIQCQCPLAFGNALRSAIGQYLDGSKQHMGARMLRRQPERHPSRFERISEGLFNATLAATALVVLAIPLLVVAIAIKLSSRGPVFFRQVRVGYRGRPFRIYKFRTMEQECRTSESGTLFDDNRRATIVGRVLRDWKIDELPQLVNVLAGDMNIVGPRPEVPEFVGKYCEPDKSIILSVSPGITDFASIRFRHEE